MSLNKAFPTSARGTRKRLYAVRLTACEVVRNGLDRFYKTVCGNGWSCDFLLVVFILPSLT